MSDNRHFKDCQCGCKPEERSDKIFFSKIQDANDYNPSRPSDITDYKDGTAVVIHGVRRREENWAFQMVYFRDEDDRIMASVPMTSGHGYELNDELKPYPFPPFRLGGPLHNLQKKLEEEKKEIDQKQSNVGFDILDELLAEPECICRMTAQGPVEDPKCMWHLARKKK